MKFEITFRDPDAVYESFRDADEEFDDLSPEVESILNKFLDFKEYITIEFDTDLGTAVVLPK